MKNNLALLAVGVILVLAGVAQLAQNIIGPLPAILWAALFGFAGLCFIPVYRRSRDNWWAIIPMLTLLGLALLLGLGETLGELAVALFFPAIAASFLVVYVTHRDMWWAIIPCLVLTGLAVMVGMAGSAGPLSASVLFVVCAAAFVFLRTRGVEFLVGGDPGWRPGVAGCAGAAGREPGGGGPGSAVLRTGGDLRSDLLLARPCAAPALAGDRGRRDVRGRHSGLGRSLRAFERRRCAGLDPAGRLDPVSQLFGPGRTGAAAAGAVDLRVVRLLRNGS